MKSQHLSSNFQQLNVIYLALIAGQLSFAGVAYFLAMDSETASELGIMSYLVPAISISTIGASYFIYNMLIQKGQTLEDAVEKLGHYRMSNIVRWALIEGGNLFAIVIFLISGQTYLLAFFALGLGIFLLYRPSKNGFINDYQLNGEERVLVERS